MLADELAACAGQFAGAEVLIIAACVAFCTIGGLLGYALAKYQTRKT